MMDKDQDTPPPPAASCPLPSYPNPSVLQLSLFKARYLSENAESI